LPALLCAILPAFASAQDNPPLVTGQDSEAADPFIIEYYTPRKASVVPLNNTIVSLLQARYMRGVHFSVLGETLLIQAQASLMPEVLALVEQVDRNYATRGERAAIDEEQVIYKLKYVSLNAVREALRFMDRAFMPNQPATAPTGLSIGYVEERGVILVRGSSADVAQAVAILAELDVAPPSLMLTCYLVQASTEESSPRLPAALVRDLAALVPYKGFELLSSGMLPSNGGSELGLDVELAGDRGEFNLTMRPAAYDPKLGLLSLSQIKFQMSLNETVDGKRQRTQRSFATSTSLATDKFTVLGAVGADPVFVVVRMTQLGN
jgi:hypothetical protein